MRVRAGEAEQMVLSFSGWKKRRRLKVWAVLGDKWGNFQ